MLGAGGWVELGTGSWEVREVAHSPQNFARTRFSKPQFEQRSLKGVAHSIQNFTPSGLSEPQLWQCIAVPGKKRQGEKGKRRNGEMAKWKTKNNGIVLIVFLFAFSPFHRFALLRERSCTTSRRCHARSCAYPLPGAPGNCGQTLLGYGERSRPGVDSRWTT